MFPGVGTIKLSELLHILQDTLEEQGDRDVYLPGYDYPQPISGIRIQQESNGYVPKESYVLI